MGLTETSDVNTGAPAPADTRLPTVTSMRPHDPPPARAPGCTTGSGVRFAVRPAQRRRLASASRWAFWRSSVIHAGRWRFLAASGWNGPAHCAGTVRHAGLRGRHLGFGAVHLSGVGGGVHRHQQVALLDEGTLPLKCTACRRPQRGVAPPRCTASMRPEKSAHSAMSFCTAATDQARPAVGALQRPERRVGR